MSLPSRILVLLLVLLAAFATGWGMAVRKAARDAMEEQLKRSESNREAERLASSNMARLTDDLLKARAAGARASADLRGWMREQAASGAASPAIAACRSDETATAARVLPESIQGDLGAGVDEAEDLADRLRVCQGALAEWEKLRPMIQR